MGDPLRVQTDRPPTPGEIEAARMAIMDSMEAAAARIHTDRTTWWKWEQGKREMPIASWELYLIKARRVRRKKAKQLGLA